MSKKPLHQHHRKSSSNVSYHSRSSSSSTSSIDSPRSISSPRHNASSSSLSTGNGSPMSSNYRGIIFCCIFDNCPTAVVDNNGGLAGESEEVIRPTSTSSEPYMTVIECNTLPYHFPSLENQTLKKSVVSAAQKTYPPAVTTLENHSQADSDQQGGKNSSYATNNSSASIVLDSPLPSSSYQHRRQPSSPRSLTTSTANTPTRFQVRLVHIGVYDIYTKLCSDQRYCVCCVSIGDHNHQFRSECKQLVKDICSEFDKSAFKEFRTSFNRKMMTSTMLNLVQNRNNMMNQSMKSMEFDERTGLLSSSHGKQSSSHYDDSWYRCLLCFSCCDED